jgi:hypothetical protein
MASYIGKHRKPPVRRRTVRRLITGLALVAMRTLAGPK